MPGADELRSEYAKLITRHFFARSAKGVAYRVGVAFDKDLFARFARRRFMILDDQTAAFCARAKRVIYLS
jgi:hypothetical protein